LSEKAPSERILTVPQVKKLLENMGEENLDQFQRRTLDYASKFSKVKAEACDELLKELVEEFDLEEEEAVQIVNCMPSSVEELKVFLAGGRKIVENTKLKALVDLLDKHRDPK